MAVIVRPERAGDIARVRQINLSAFGTPVEADLVDALRGQVSPLVSVVAAEGEAILGHILFSPVTLSSDPSLRVLGLGPMAVEPSRQRQGIGSMLVTLGLEECRRFADALVVLGHPEYYPRFGFRPASTFGLRSDYDVPDEAFMAMELRPGALNGKAGTAHYHPAFPSTA